MVDRGVDADEGVPRVDEDEGAPEAHVVDAEDVEVVVVVVDVAADADADEVAAELSALGQCYGGTPWLVSPAESIGHPRRIWVEWVYGVKGE